MKQRLVDSAQAVLFDLQAQVKTMRALYLRLMALADEAREAGAAESKVAAVEAVIITELKEAIREVKDAESKIHDEINTQFLDGTITPRFGK